MHTNRLGRTGLFVSELCLGTMTFGGTDGSMWQKIGSVQQAEADRMVGSAIDAGINFIDTADVYSEGLAEQITGQAIRNLGTPRGNIVLATKVYGTMGDGPDRNAHNNGGNSRKHIMEGVKASLKRLQTDYIDLYQIHGFDPATPIEETVRAMDLLVQHGHVRHVGVSNWAAWQIATALGIAERQGLSRFDTLQAYYTIAGRDIEREIAPLLAHEQMGLLVWSPLAGGLLSGKYDRDGAATSNPTDTRRAQFDFPPVVRDRAFDCIDAMRPISDARNVSVAQIALAWLLHRKVVSSVIIGAKTIDQLSDNIAATSLDLTEAELDTLDQVSQLPAEYPGWMFAMQGGRSRQLSAAGRVGAR